MEGTIVKKTLSFATIALALVVCAGAQQDAGTTNPAPQQQPAAVEAVPSAPATTFAGASSRHYAVWSDAGKDDAVALAETLDGLFGVYNEYFRFDEGRLKALLTVRKFAEKIGRASCRERV